MHTTSYHCSIIRPILSSSRNIVPLRHDNTGVRPYSSKSDLATTTPAHALTSSDGVTAVPIDFDVAARVEGQESQIVTVDLEPGQVLRAESGAMLFMTAGVTMETTTGGGVSAGFKRMLTGQNVFISDFSYDGSAGAVGQVALGTDFPAKIVRLNVDDYGGKLVCQKGALLCASHTIDIEMEFAKKMTAGFFGGEGFVLQALTGTGDVFVKAGGTLINKVLAEGETLRVSSGSLVAFENGVDFDVQTMPGFKNVVFGGEGLFVTTLTGPGNIWLQGMPSDRMIDAIARRVPSGGGLGMGLPIGMMGGGGGGSEGGEGDGGGEDSGEGGEGGGDAVAATDAAMEADRNATVAASGMGMDDGTDNPDSPSALFGDAAGDDNTASTDSSGNSSSTTTFGDDDVSSQSSNEFEDSTFSTTDDDFNDFTNDDFTQEDTFDTEDSFSSGDMDDGGGGGDEDGGSGIMGTLWDLFTGGGDD